MPAQVRIHILRWHRLRYVPTANGMKLIGDHYAVTVGVPSGTRWRNKMCRWPVGCTVYPTPHCWGVWRYCNIWPQTHDWELEWVRGTL
jgi:hypothetical protein